MSTVFAFFSNILTVFRVYHELTSTARSRTRRPHSIHSQSSNASDVFGQQKPKELPQEPERLLSDVEEVYALRYIRLLALGLEPTQAIQLIEIPDVAAEAEALHAKGCPPSLIVDLLKGD